MEKHQYAYYITERTQQFLQMTTDYGQFMDQESGCVSQMDLSLPWSWAIASTEQIPEEGK